MAFFVILLALAVFSPEKLQTMDSVAASISGVQREIEVFQEATAENLVMEQFRSARVEPTVYDIIEEQRSDQPPREAAGAADDAGDAERGRHGLLDALSDVFAEATTAVDDVVRRVERP